MPTLGLKPISFSIFKRLHNNAWATDWKTRVFLALRWAMTPYSDISKHVPKSGVILDLGCGHGLFSMLLAFESSSRRVIGIDHDEKRISSVSNAARDVSNLSFRLGNVGEQLEEGAYEAITLIDVLHYFPLKEQERITSICKRALKKTGVLLVREIEPKKGFSYYLNHLYEKVATSIGFTKTKAGEIYIRSKAQWQTTFEKAGFTVTQEKASHPLFSDILYICRLAS